MMSEGIEHHSAVFDLKFLVHVFHGERRLRPSGRGVVSGFHHEGAAMRAAYGTKVIEGTRAGADGNGVYKAEIVIEGKKKKGSSPFFPRCWSKVEVLQAIRQAYATRLPFRSRENGRWWVGHTRSNMRVVLCLDASGQLVTAFPLPARKASAATKRSRHRCRLRRDFRRYLVVLMLVELMRQNEKIEVKKDESRNVESKS